MDINFDFDQLLQLISICISTASHEWCSKVRALWNGTTKQTFAFRTYSKASSTTQVQVQLLRKNLCKQSRHAGKFTNHRPYETNYSLISFIYVTIFIPFDWFVVYRGTKKATLEIMFIRANFARAHSLFTVHSKLISEEIIGKNLN